MENRQVRALIEQADSCRRSHDWATAIDLLKRALAIDAEHAQAHGTLALALLGARRLHGAVIEADLALAFDANDPFCHYAVAAVRAAERKLDDAWKHVLVALHDDDADADTHVLAAHVKVLMGERDAARTLLDEALAIDGDHVDALTELASLDLHEGHLAEAQLRIATALAIDPSDVDAHITAGYIAIRAGKLEDAEHHARFALQENASDRGALELWTALKARRNVFLGLWWRINSFAALRSERAQIGIMIGSFVVVRLLVIVLGALGYEDIEIFLERAWLGLCAYSWFAPEIFEWMLKRELKTVVLSDDY